MIDRQDYFNPNIVPDQVDWLVDGYIPLGGYFMVVAQPGVGKSFMLESLAVDVACGGSFLGKKTARGDVLLIDEDSDPDSAHLRLVKFSRCYPDVQPRLVSKIREGYRIVKGDTQSLAALVKRYDSDNLKLIIIDTLTGIVGGKSSLDNTQDSSAVGELLQEISRPDRAVVVAHHASKNKTLTVDIAMSGDNPDSFVMNNTSFIAKSKGYFLVASADKGRRLKELMVRPVSRRVVLPDPFSMLLYEDEERMFFTFAGHLWKDTGDLKEGDRVILSEWNDNPDALLSTDNLKNMTQGYCHENTLRSHLAILKEKGYIVLCRKEGKGGMHYYGLTDVGKDFAESAGAKKIAHTVKLYSPKKGEKK